MESQYDNALRPTFVAALLRNAGSPGFRAVYFVQISTALWPRLPAMRSTAARHVI